ncbi:HAMP domain-containing histidine kinase [Flavihumibacter sp. R14]|nr:HAMP domain-containing histidine kinase [Flavihumibacter soli]
MALALLGVMAMQFYFLRQSFQLKSQLFDQNVNEALDNVVAKLEKHDANTFLTNKVEIKHATQETAPREYVTAHKPRPVRKPVRKRRPVESYASMLRAEQRKADSIFWLRDSLYRMRNPNVIAFNDVISAAELKNMEYKLQVDIIQVQDALGQVHERTQQTLSKALRTPAVTEILNATAFIPDSVRQYVTIDPQTGRPSVYTLAKPKLTHISRPPLPPEPQEPVEKVKVRKVKEYFDAEKENRDLFEDLATEYQQVYMPLNKRVHPLILDSMLRDELQNQSINSYFEYKVTSAKRDSLIFTRASTSSPFLPYNTYQTALFPKDMIRDAGLLTITFPEKNNVILANLTAMMGLSGGLLLILLFCFGYTIHSILQQKKLSEMKTDFINNMTHEFKTPVATIMLASEALKDPELTADKSRLDRLANIIYDENVRLGNHIERVLNIAKIDKGNLKLEHKEVEMNDLLAAIIDSMALQLEKRNAKVELQLNAKNAMVMGDELHLSNVIFNLIDNANKYSKDDPEIRITTQNVGKNIVIKVADKGIGMNRDQQAKIFSQFYRIPTGNLHDVKGFGLGLSYVSDIVKRLKGHIKVRSEKDKGSEFEITLPVYLAVTT